MASEGVWDRLGKDFVALTIDQDRAVGGKELVDELRHGRGGGIPWFMFLDSEGNELAASNNDDDARGGNVGFPQTESEVAWFAKMLKKTRRNLTDDDVAWLAASLERVREERERAAKEARAKRESGR